MLRYLTIILIVVLSTANTVAKDDYCIFSSIEEYTFAANIAIDERSYTTAINYLSCALKIDEDNANLYYLRGTVYVDLSLPDLALSDFQKAVSLDLDNVAYRVGLGKALGIDGQIELAIETLQNVIVMDPSYPESYIALSEVYWQMGNIENAIIVLNEAENVVDPLVPAQYVLRGVLYTDLGEFSIAMENYNIAIEIDSSHAPAYFFRGELFSEQMQYARAIEDYTEAILQDSYLADAYFGRAFAGIQLDVPLSIILDDLNTGLRISPDDYDALNLRGMVYFSLEDCNSAIEDGLHLIELYPERPEPYSYVGLCYATEGNIELGINHIEHGIEIYPEFPESYWSLGTIYYVQDDFETALIYFSIYRTLIGDDITQDAIDFITYVEGLR